MRRTLTLFALFVPLVVSPLPAERFADVSGLEPCVIEGAGDAFCGGYEVYEDRAAGQGRKIRLNVVVLPAKSADPAADPVFFFAGGPGGAATDAAPRIDSFTPSLRRQRDFVLVDQRGTGDSNPLTCTTYGDEPTLQDYLGALMPRPAMEACRAELEERADLALYTTPIAMDDIDDVRAWLGYEQINLLGSSYGSRAAMTYLARHGEHVRTATLMGVVPPAEVAHRARSRNAERTMNLLFLECARNKRCLKAFPDVRQELLTVLQRLDQEPAKLEVHHPRTRRKEEVTLGRDVFTSTLLYMIWSSKTAIHVPSLIHEAFNGNYEPAVKMTYLLRRQFGGGLAYGMNLSVTCSEDTPRIDPAVARADAAGTFLSASRLEEQLELCSIWRRGEVPSSHFEPVRSDVPVLMLSGWLDWIPPRWAEEAASYLPNSLQVVGRYGHHDYPAGGPCRDKVVHSFVEAGTVAGLRTSCLEEGTALEFNVSEGFFWLELLLARGL